MFVTYIMSVTPHAWNLTPLQSFSSKKPMQITNEVKPRLLRERRFHVKVGILTIVAVIVISEALLANLWLIAHGY